MDLERIPSLLEQPAEVAQVVVQQAEPEASDGAGPPPTPGSSAWLKNQGLVTEGGSGALPVLAATMG